MFGENITERVVNTVSPTNEDGEDEKNATSSEDKTTAAAGTTGSDEASRLPTSTSTNNVASSSWLNDAESAEKYATALHESDLYSLCKINCRLYVLEAEKSNWAERGYGILKVIETSDGSNCRISKNIFSTTF